MASRRQLKKKINYAFTMTIGMCGMYTLNTSKEKQEAIYDIVLKLINLKQDLISRVSHTEPGNVKGFYKKLKDDMNVESQKILQGMVEICSTQK